MKIKIKMNNKQKDFCKKYNLTENQFFGKEKIGSNLDLRVLITIPIGFNPTVWGDLYLSGLITIPKGFNPTVGGNLYLGGLIKIPKGFNPTAGGNLYLRNLIKISKGFNPTVGDNLYLGSLIKIPKGFNPTVGGYLYLRGLIKIPKGFNPTVGAYLDLRGLIKIPKGFNPTVGGDLYLRGLTCKHTRLNGRLISWCDGKYIKVDGIFTEVINKRGNVYIVKKINSEKLFYLVTDGDKYSYGETLKLAKKDLIYKLNSFANKEVFMGLQLTDKLSFGKAIECYIVITRVC